jgi:pyruvate/2-oxoglutarate dehydrogenase complex dihydrolipoamide acyltransferase (E2) component
MGTLGVTRAAQVHSTRPLAGVEAYLWAFKRRAREHHCIGYGTFRVEVDRLAALRRRYAREVSPITLLPILVKATALAIERNPEANAILFKRLFGYRVVGFDQADVNLPLTRDVDGSPFTFLLTVRGAARKRLAEIQEEISRAMRCAAAELPQLQRIRRFSNLPLWLARVFHARMTRSPEFYLANAGTCGLTTLEAAAGEYFFPIGPTSAVFAVGGSRPEPVVRDGQIVVRRMMNVCLAVDNYVVSGPAGAKLGRDFTELVESGSFVAAELKPSRGSVAARPEAP